MTDLPQIAVLGCGAWGRNHVRTFAQLGALGAVCDSDGGAAREVVAAWPEVAVFEHLDDLLGHSGIAGIVIATPAVTHAALAERALQAGKDVLIEKPMATDPGEADALVGCARAAGRICMVGHILEYHPGFVALRRAVEGGTIGEICTVESRRLSSGRVRREEDVLWSFAPHDLAMVTRLLGAPVTVRARTERYLGERADVGEIELGYARASATIRVSWIYPGKEQCLTVIGRQGALVFDDVAKKVWRFDRPLAVDEGGRFASSPDNHEIVFARDEPLRRQAQAFLDAIVSRTPPVADGTSGAAVVRILAAASRSAAQEGECIALGEAG